MDTQEKLEVNYITNAKGEKSAVILPIEQFYELLEDLHDLAVIAERRDEATISHEEMLRELEADGFLSD